MRALVVIGTRPEAIKLAPVVHALQRRPGCSADVLLTSQHTDLLHPMLDFFQVTANYDLQVMTSAQKLEDVAARILTGTAERLKQTQPNVVLVQGDTTTAFAAGLAAFYQGIPVAHVEAGLRSGNLFSPFPEEAHRRFVDLFATYYFPPTSETEGHLLKENIPAERIWRTGNTGIDALLHARERISTLEPSWAKFADEGERFVLVTTHRRESFGEPMRNVFRALQDLAEANPGLRMLVPLHPNPQVREAAKVISAQPRIRFGEPLNYPEFVAAMSRADLILTDSGGVQEEAPSLGVPVLVLRENTERPEAVACGATELVGTNPARILERATALLKESKKRTPQHVYGDGLASERIVDVLQTGKLQRGEFVGIVGT
jgi:UDP-N-acetylglucosamine 2-epimerase (non-hydrolysing)